MCNAHRQLGVRVADLLPINLEAVFVCRRPANSAEYSLKFPLDTASTALLEMLLRHEGGELLRDSCADQLVDGDSFPARRRTS